MPDAVKDVEVFAMTGTAAAERAAPPTEEHAVRVAILGAGMSGICMGIQLKKKGIDDFVILEKAESVGGTWRENRYPGIACDVPSHVYSFSFELNPNWSHSYSSGREIWDYCERCVEKYGLGPHIRFGTEVSDVVFDGARWTVTTKDGGRVTANLVVSGLGGLHSPKHADIKGLKGFEGPVFHTAEWPDGFDLKGRRVAIIGTGAMPPRCCRRLPTTSPRSPSFSARPPGCSHGLRATFRRRRGHASADIRG